MPTLHEREPSIHPCCVRALAAYNTQTMARACLSREVSAPVCAGCGKPTETHPEFGNVGRRRPFLRVKDVVGHQGKPMWFVRRYVKLAFPYGVGCRELMWVRVVEFDVLSGHFKGTLANTPLYVAAQHGAEVEFVADEILDVSDDN